MKGMLAHSMRVVLLALVSATNTVAQTQSSTTPSPPDTGSQYRPTGNIAFYNFPGGSYEVIKLDQILKEEVTFLVEGTWTERGTSYLRLRMRSRQGRERIGYIETPARTGSDPTLARSSAVRIDKGVDLLSTGVVIRAVATFERTKQQGTDTMSFFVNEARNGGSSVLIRLLPDYALNKAFVSSELYGRLVTGDPVSIRLAGIASLEAGALLDSGLLAAAVQCGAPQLGKRDLTNVVYLLRCVNTSADRRAKNEQGEMVFEVVVAVTTPNQSAVDQFLVRRLLADVVSDPIFLRVEK